MDAWRCPRCGRDVDVSWASGEPLVMLFATRFFHPPSRGVTQSMEPAGDAHAQICLRCDVEVWPALRALLAVPRVAPAEDGGGTR
jgi:hypothetical protein